MFKMKIELNQNFEKLSENYLFSEVALRVEQQRKEGSNQKIISLGIGDLTRPLAPCVAEKMSRTAKSMGTKEGFSGYGDIRGTPALRRAVAEYYTRRNVVLNENEIFINDGAKSDLANLLELFGDAEIVICDPVYPVYFDSAVMSGKMVWLLEATKENDFLPTPKNLPLLPFVIYLCSPNNPTGAVFSREKLKGWVDFALKSGSIIIFDAAYETYITDKNLPHSIFEIEGANECAIEVCSFSKMAGFTGVRCGWTVVPMNSKLNKMWMRRQSTKFNGASYISQMGALAALSSEGMSANMKNVAHYMNNAKILSDFLSEKGISFCGGRHAPYLWVECPKEMDSWTFFDYILQRVQIVTTPGIGFGKSGNHRIRLSSFAPTPHILEAIERLNKIL
jgi:LL-diaminopimelate aminotransferase